ncbi:gag-pol polyprotein [Tanacetum coccineum]
MPYLLSQFISLNLNSSKSIVVANGDFMSLADIGSVDTPSVALSDVYYIQNLTMNLASGEADFTATYVINRIPTAHNSGLFPFEKLYVTSLEHISYYSVPASSHDLTQSQLIKIDPFEEPTPIVSPITPEPALETTSETTTTTETPIVSPITPKPASETTTTTETPRVIISEAKPTVTQPPPTTTQSSFEVAVVPPVNIRPTRIQVVCDPLWQVAMAKLLAALHQTQTWDLVPLRVDKHAIGSRWVYKIKTKFDGSLERYKARLVAKGYAQEYGMDYEETFIVVVKMTTNAILNGDLNEEVLMKPPPGVSYKPGKVCKLRKALYGLKQAPRAWYEKFETIVTSLGFVSSHHDSVLFVKQSSVGRILLSLYVDDMIITGDDYIGIELLKLELAHRFAMKDLGLLHYNLGIQVASSPKGYLLSQSKYIGVLLDRARITDKMVKDIPIDAKAKYTLTDGNPLPDPSLY